MWVKIQSWKLVNRLYYIKISHGFYLHIHVERDENEP